MSNEGQKIIFRAVPVAAVIAAFVGGVEIESGNHNLGGFLLLLSWGLALGSASLQGG